MALVILRSQFAYTFGYQCPQERSCCAMQLELRESPPRHGKQLKKTHTHTHTETHTVSASIASSLGPTGLSLLLCAICSSSFKCSCLSCDHFGEDLICNVAFYFPSERVNQMWTLRLVKSSLVVGSFPLPFEGCINLVAS